MTRVRTVEHIADVRRRPGTQRPVEHRFPASAFGPVATTAALVPPESEVVLDGVLEATGLDIVLTGTITFGWEGECRRCLQPVTGELTTELREVFEPTPVEGETWPIEGDAIDLGPVLRDIVLLALPIVPLCSEDCPGPDPERFPTSVAEDLPAAGPDRTEADAEDAPSADPRWAALDQLKFE